MVQFPLSPLVAGEAVVLFREELMLCNLKRTEKALIISDTSTNPHYVAACFGAVLDLGAGTGWMSYRLALRGHHPVAVDILTDPHEGLGASRHYFERLGRKFTCLDAEFDQLPLPDGQFDAVVYNASLHYSSDYHKTFAEAKRCLRPGGRIVVLDSPVYRLREHGERMRRERHEQFLAQYGTQSDHIASIEYLDLRTIATLAREIGIAWRIHKPWYGLAWDLRPWKARMLGKRPPSRFWILEGKLTG